MADSRIKASPAIEKLIEGGLFDRLPVTFGAYCLQQIRDWTLLFPAEQNRYERVFTLFGRMDAAELDKLFAGVRAAETQMGVNETTWPRGRFTLDQVDFLNRNAHYPEWRAAITEVFARIDPLIDNEIAANGHSRLAIVISPIELPATPDRMWTRIADKGRRVSIQAPEDTTQFLAQMLTGAEKAAGKQSIVAEYREKFARPYDTWSIETGDAIGPRVSAGVDLSYTRLEPYRKRLMTEVTRLIRAEHIQGPRQLSTRLRQLKIMPAESSLGSDALLSEFVRSIFLSGNGTLLINNTFVEWASVQAVRRARPSLAVVGLGIRNKVKPFSSMLIFEDQETSNPIPTQMDILGSLVDLQIIYQYIWQEFEKYAEYRRNTAFLFVSEGLDQMLVIAPPDFPVQASTQALPLTRVHGAMREWLNLA